MKTTKRTVELLSGTTLAIRPDNYYRHPLLYNVAQSGYVIGGLKHSVSRAGYNSYGLYGVLKGEVVLKTKNIHTLALQFIPPLKKWAFLF